MRTIKRIIVSALLSSADNKLFFARKAPIAGTVYSSLADMTRHHQ